MRPGPRSRRLLPWALAATVTGPVSLVSAPAAARALPEPGHSVPHAAWVERSLSPVPPGQCREQVERDLLAGRRTLGTCEHSRRHAARGLVRIASGSPVFGVVESRVVKLTGVDLLLARADRCERWPLRSPGAGVLGPHDARWGGCRVRRHHGTVTVSVLGADGTRHERVLDLRADADGHARLSFSDLDRRLRVGGLGSLDRYTRVEIGVRGWAGVIDMPNLREFIADWHFDWVSRGRGVPALFDVRHPDHPRAGDARALAVEDRLARQERDYLAVARGELDPRVFLRRHAWSPYRRSVTTMITSGAIEANAPAPSAPTD